MRGNRSMIVVTAVLLLGPGAPWRAALGKDGDPATPAEAVALARPLFAAAVKAKPAETKEVTESVRRGIEALKAQSKEGFKQKGLPLKEFEALWNLGISVGCYHGVKQLPEYRFDTVRMEEHPVQFGLPVGRDWSFASMRPGKDDQLWGEIHRNLAGGRVIRQIKIWVYKWNTTYSGTGGENAKGLAEGDFLADREAMTKVTARSLRVVTARLSKGFPKASFYEVTGEDEKLGPARRRDYYVKGSSTTYNFEVIELRKTEPADDPWAAWQASAPDPELEAVLDSFGEYELKKK